LRKIIIYLLFAAFAAYVIFAVWIDLSYFLSLPKAPEEQTGRIYRMVVSHGSVRYGSVHELQYRKALDDFRLVPIVAFFCAVVLGLKWGILHIGKSGRQ
jgi:hypothetical protein